VIANKYGSTDNKTVAWLCEALVFWYQRAKDLEAQLQLLEQKDEV
jgi:hypothetical protein